MLQDFQFKNIHRARNQHLNVNALSQNPIGFMEEDEDFGSDVVATPLWPSVGVTPNTWKSWRLGVFRDSRMF
jgi:hypothetical protein